jgi:hypothetical protein
MLWILPLIVAILLWFRLKFWNRQPIRHYLTLYKKGILADHPVDNKFVVPQVLFYNVTELTNELENELYDYVKEKQTSYHKKSHFIGYLKKGYVSIYFENRSIRGCLTSRQVEFKFDNETVEMVAAPAIPSAACMRVCVRACVRECARACACMHLSAPAAAAPAAAAPVPPCARCP